MDGHASRPEGGFNGKRARPAHWIDQGLPRLPSGQGQQAGRQDLVERSAGPGRTIAALEQGILAHQIEGDGDLLPGDVQVNELVRSRPVDVEMAAALSLHPVPEMVAHGVLHPEHGKLVVGEMVAVDRHVEGHRLARINPLAPIELHRLGVQVIGALGLETEHGTQDAHREPRRLQEAVQPLLFDGEGHAAPSLLNVDRPAGLRLGRHQRLEPHEGADHILYGPWLPGFFQLAHPPLCLIEYPSRVSQSATRCRWSPCRSTAPSFQPPPTPHRALSAFATERAMSS